MPACSIIIPVYNRASVTRQCLNLLLSQPTTIDHEIIVVDDGSRDLTPRLLQSYGDRIRTITHETNQGFATACNDGAAAARGEYLVFLNNDTAPTEGWLDALVGYASAHPEASVVGSKLLYADGTIQHAGVVVCQDRFSRNIYAGLPADHPVVNRSRRFQAVCGACMLVRRVAFEEVGGFDIGYVNAYEDHDLCFRLGERGYQSHYCHTSVLVHYESVTRGKRNEAFARSSARFRQRWAHRLQPDDLDYLVRDGMLRMVYSETYPIRIEVSPLAALVNTDDHAHRADALLAIRAQQVAALLDETTSLRVKLLEAEAAAQAEAGDAAAEQASPDTQEPLSTLTPPAELARLVGGEFVEASQEFLQYFLGIGGLQPDEDVLEVGCGVGRMAVPLLEYLSDEGSYAGFDVMRDAIDWCTRTLTPRNPRFQFHHIDVFNAFYNPRGPIPSTAYRFPYPDCSFDFVFLTSVFTHMLPADLEHYAAEIARVLRPGGRCFLTAFLLNEESVGLMRAGFAGPFVFKPSADVYAATNLDVPEAAVAYPESYLLERLACVGLIVSDPIRYGRWCGRLDGMSLQDVLLAVKQAPAAG